MTTRLQRWEIEDQGGNWSSYRTLVPVDMTPERRRGLTWDDPGEWVRADAVAPLEDRIAELEAEVKQARADHLRLCRDLAMHTQGWGCVPGGSPREAAEVEVRVKEAKKLGASDEALEEKR